MGTHERQNRPGLKKVGTPPILLRRKAELVASLGGRVAELIDAASILSEGQPRDDGDEVVYYGMTSVLFMLRSAGGLLPDASMADLEFALRHDPHVRLELVRIAHREASTRAGAGGGVDLGPLHADIMVATTSRGPVATIEVMVRVLGRRVPSTAF